ncbi:MAG: hypothetical protein WBP93_09965 [Pyrinomonadaceae bacterium]
MKCRARNLVLFLTFFLIFTASRSVAQSTQGEKSEAEREHWGFSFVQYHRPGSKLIPVEISRLVGEPLPDKQLSIKVTKLKNHSPKGVTGIKFSWFLFDGKDLNTVILTRQSALIDLSYLSTGEEREVDIPITTPKEIISLRNGEDFKGRFMLEVAVTEVRYDDGSIWEGKDIPAKLEPSQITQ